MDPGAAVKQEGAQQQHHQPVSLSASSAGQTQPSLPPPSDNQANGMAEFGDISEKDLVDFDDEDDSNVMDCN